MIFISNCIFGAEIKNFNVRNRSRLEPLFFAWCGSQLRNLGLPEPVPEPSKKVAAPQHCCFAWMAAISFISITDVYKDFRPGCHGVSEPSLWLASGLNFLFLLLRKLYKVYSTAQYVGNLF